MFSAIRQVARTSLPLRATRPCASSVHRFPAHRTIVTKKYTADHESVAFDDQTGLGTIAITDYAQQSLGDVVFVDLPSVGLKIYKGETIGAVESVKAASDIYAPVSGEVVEVNTRLDDEPGLVNRSPDDQGWLCKIKLTEPKEIDDLLTLEAYAKTYES
ncbi:glycine cleavage H-protein-domain-containing protein [Boletus edulis BED1]|uniref:Glycine cleavage system H protein n=1 Tax=Boletus edulis BED1 TaxID=1328754 RepID=A0AAD4BHI3_BOLED|nr:glycine cleavage H-protein-domain-containing protein [Boletus edulis BED1]